MKINGCSCLFVFAVFNNFNKTRVRVRSCSIFSKTNVFVFVRVQYFAKNPCSCSFMFDIFSKKMCSCSFVFIIFTKSTRSCSVRVHVRVRHNEIGRFRSEKTKWDTPSCWSFCPILTYVGEINDFGMCLH